MQKVIQSMTNDATYHTDIQILYAVLEILTTALYVTPQYKGGLYQSEQTPQEENENGIITCTTSPIRLRGCNCRLCRENKKHYREKKKSITKTLNRNIRYENKKLCRNPDHVFNTQVSFYYF